MKPDLTSHLFLEIKSGIELAAKFPFLKDIYYPGSEDVDWGHLATQGSWLEGGGGGQTPQRQTGACLVLLGAGVKSLENVVMLRQDVMTFLYLEYPGVEDDHDQAGDVEGSEGRVDDEVRVVKHADNRVRILKRPRHVT